MGKRQAISHRLRFEVLKRDGFACRYCGQRPPDVVLHLDHVVPVARGGTNEMANLCACCSACNLGKSDELVEGDTCCNEARKMGEFSDSFNFECSESEAQFLPIIDILRSRLGAPYSVIEILKDLDDCHDPGAGAGMSDIEAEAKACRSYGEFARAIWLLGEHAHTARWWHTLDPDERKRLRAQVDELNAEDVKKEAAAKANAAATLTARDRA